MPTFTIPIPGGGEYHVDAEDEDSAYQNVGLTPPGGGGGDSGGDSGGDGGGEGAPPPPSSGDAPVPGSAPSGSDQTWDTLDDATRQMFEAEYGAGQGQAGWEAENAARLAQEQAAGGGPQTDPNRDNWYAPAPPSTGDAPTPGTFVTVAPEEPSPAATPSPAAGPTVPATPPATPAGAGTPPGPVTPPPATPAAPAAPAKPPIVRVTPDGKTISFTSPEDAKAYDDQLTKFAESEKQAREADAQNERDKIRLTEVLNQAQIAYWQAQAANASAQLAQQMAIEKMRMAITQQRDAMMLSLEREKIAAQLRSQKGGRRVSAVRYR